MSLKRQFVKLAVMIALIAAAAWYALSGPLNTPVPAPPPAGWTVSAGR
ncbi:MAG: hypothetical protein JNK29_13235 [Anaerolineales bacterium]|nr:hypothetical protein [Anaerolineales bacterium]